MAGGRSPGWGRSRGGRSGNDPLRRLAQLGAEDPGAPAARTAAGSTANESGLRALGERMSRGGKGGGAGAGPDAPSHRRQPRWSTRRKVLTALGATVLLIVGIVGGGYLYLQYEWGKVHKVDCTSCAVVTSSVAPFNVLVIGSDTRAGNSGQAAQSFGTQSQVGGERSDTIKIIHVDPKAGTAELLSIPRDTWVEMSGLPSSTGLSGPQKINTAYNDGPVPLVQTIENTFGIPINHVIAVDFLGVINAVQSVGGINLKFNYPVRDYDPGTGNNNSGLYVPTTGCQTLNGNQTLALARSRYFEYYNPSQGGWNGDPSSDLGRIQRQNLIIEALMSKVESTYNPLTLRAFLDSVVHDIEVDSGLGPGLLFDLATHYHAFSPSKLATFTLPTYPAQNYGGDVEIVQEPQAQQMLTQFLGGPPNTPTTPPLDASSNPMSVPSATTPAPGPSASGGSATAAPVSTATPAATLPAYDPTPC